MNKKNFFRLMQKIKELFCICVVIYALLSNIGFIPSMTYQHVYPFIRDAFNPPFVPLTFSEIRFDGQYLFLSPLAILGVIAIHFFDMYLYVSVTSLGINLVSFFIIRKRLSDRGYKKFLSMRDCTQKSPKFP
ncbi:hypothetical protein [Erwinia amylovora]|uniref:hypothetical protein n=1 Tax=Erwinia amylovora TaxID=552 RepID=UPI000C085497|nr:hypothetical protein [Erwinia amylovora]